MKNIPRGYFEKSIQKEWWINFPRRKFNHYITSFEKRKKNEFWRNDRRAELKFTTVLVCTKHSPFWLRVYECYYKEVFTRLKFDLAFFDRVHRLTSFFQRVFSFFMNWSYVVPSFRWWKKNFFITSIPTRTYEKFYKSTNYEAHGVKLTNVEITFLGHACLV